MDARDTGRPEITSRTAGLAPYPANPTGRPSGSRDPRQGSGATLGAAAAIGLGVVAAVAWSAVAAAAIHDYPHADDYPDPVGAGLEAMLDVIGIIVGLLGAASAAGGAAARVFGKRLLAWVLLGISAGSPVVVAAGFLVWMLLMPS